MNKGIIIQMIEKELLRYNADKSSAISCLGRIISILQNSGLATQMSNQIVQAAFLTIRQCRDIDTVSAFAKFVTDDFMRQSVRTNTSPISSKTNIESTTEERTQKSGKDL